MDLEKHRLADDQQSVRRRRQRRAECIKGESAWNAASVSGPNDDGNRTALISPAGSTGTNEARLTIHSVDPRPASSPARATNTDCSPTAQQSLRANSRPKQPLDVIPNAGMESWSTKSMKKMFQALPTHLSERLYDQFGNRQISTQATYPGMVGG
ncbi:MAG: hypothetical protein ACLT1W_13690 [Alistipes onderdonkii]